MEKQEMKVAEPVEKTENQQILDQLPKQKPEQGEIKMTKVRKEIQGEIMPLQKEARATEEEFASVLKSVSPGTHLRTALDGALKAGRGALIMIENQKAHELMDGGFKVNCRFTPQKLVELCKMDGAITLSKDLRRINYANVLLTPSHKIKSMETGTKHKAAERVAKEVGTLVVAISERRHEITIYYKNIRYSLRSTHEVSRKANSHIQMLEKQRELFDLYISRLNDLEFRNYPSLHQALKVIQKGLLIQKISRELKRNLIELGNEGTLIKTRLKEITQDVERETNLTIKDYTRLDLKKSRNILDTLSYDEILEDQNILKSLAYEKPAQTAPIKGWRILSKTSLAEADVATVIKHVGSLGKAIHSNLNTYKDVLGEEKASIFNDEISKIKLNY